VSVAAIEPTFERYAYEPLVNAAMRIAGSMQVFQAGRHHTCLGYLLALAVLLLAWLGGAA
jgi:hypothetical protein